MSCCRADGASSPLTSVTVDRFDIWHLIEHDQRLSDVDMQNAHNKLQRPMMRYCYSLGIPV